MDIGKYIYELLLENDIVVIPGFGAFVSEYKPAEINEESDEIKPPSKVISFNQQIRNNDGLLVGHVAENKRISHFDALQKIEKEREDILYKLDSGDEVELDEIGFLFTTKENEIGFRVIDEDNLLLDAYGLEPTALEPVVEEEEIIVTPIIAEEKPEKETLETENVEDIPVELIEEYLEEEVEEEEVAPEPVMVTDEPVATSEEKTEEKKKRAWLWLLVLIPLIAVAAFALLKGYKDGNSDKIAQEINKVEIDAPKVSVAVDSLKTDTATQIVIQADSVVNTELVAEQPVDKDNAREVNIDELKYHVVGGSFSVEENADVFVEELKTKGIDAFRAGKKGSFFIVSMGAYSTFSEANNAKKEYENNNPGTEVWVWKK